MNPLRPDHANDLYEAPSLPYTVRRISFTVAREFISTWHYAKGMHNGPTACYGLFDGVHLIGVLVYATPCSENVRASVFGAESRSRVTELHRLVILDVTPRNAESFFIARAFRSFKADRPDLHAVVSFADPTFGHVGTIYQATNAVYYGESRPERAFLDQDGRLRHKRQCGQNISVAEGIARGWVPVDGLPKHRYCFLLPNDRRHGRELRSRFQLGALPYPKRDVTMNRRAA